MNKMIQVENLKKRYGEVKAVDGVSFTVNKGEVFGLLGPNGAGKTTTVEMIEGLKKMDEGEVLLDGLNIKTDYPKIKQFIGVQLQSNNFFDFLTLSEILSLFGKFYNADINPADFLNRVDLFEKHNVFYKNLSGGQKQRFSIAITLLNNPKILFLDEPTTGLDPQSRRNLWELIESLKKEGKTILLTTHFMDEAEYLADRVAIMDQGKIISTDSPKNLINQLINKGFKKKIVTDSRANLEDVFLDLTGKMLRD